MPDVPATSTLASASTSPPVPTVEIPHFSLPFRFVERRTNRPVPNARSSSPPPQNLRTVLLAAVEEQDDTKEILDCVEVILRYPKGFRVDDPEFGTPDQLFKVGGANEDEIRDAISKFESRVEAAVEVDPDALDALISRVHVNLRQKGDEGGRLREWDFPKWCAEYEAEDALPLALRRAPVSSVMAIATGLRQTAPGAWTDGWGSSPPDLEGQVATALGQVLEDRQAAAAPAPDRRLDNRARPRSELFASPSG